MLQLHPAANLVRSASVARLVIRVDLLHRYSNQSLLLSRLQEVNANDFRVRIRCPLQNRPGSELNDLVDRARNEFRLIVLHVVSTDLGHLLRRA